MKRHSVGSGKRRGVSSTTPAERSFQAALRHVRETKARWAAERENPKLAAARVQRELDTLARIAREP